MDFTIWASSLLLTLVMTTGLVSAWIKDVPPLPTQEEIQTVPIWQAVYHLLERLHERNGGSIGFEAMSNGIQL